MTTQVGSLYYPRLRRYCGTPPLHRKLYHLYVHYPWSWFECLVSVVDKVSILVPLTLSHPTPVKTDAG